MANDFSYMNGGMQSSPWWKSMPDKSTITNSLVQDDSKTAIGQERAMEPSSYSTALLPDTQETFKKEEEVYTVERTQSNHGSSAINGTREETKERQGESVTYIFSCIFKRMLFLLFFTCFSHQSAQNRIAKSGKL